MKSKNYSNEAKFCVKFLVDHGYTSDDFSAIYGSIKAEDPDYNLVQKQTDQFFVQLASALRPLWPPGDKDGKYEWRDSVGNLSRRLATLWRVRNLGSYSIETCISIAERYLSTFNNKDVKYMQVLKYFILKQTPLYDDNGKARFINKSKFADMLEGKNDEDAVQNEWQEIISSSAAGEGELI